RDGGCAHAMGARLGPRRAPGRGRARLRAGARPPPPPVPRPPPPVPPLALPPPPPAPLALAPPPHTLLALTPPPHPMGFRPVQTSAADAAGGTVTETITSAYRTGRRLLQAKQRNAAASR